MIIIDTSRASGRKFLSGAEKHISTLTDWEVYVQPPDYLKKEGPDFSLGFPLEKLDGMLIRDAVDTVNGVTVARALFCGAQAGILAYGRRIGWKEKVFEYDSQFGVEVSSIYGFSKSKFNNEDFGVITCDTRVDLDN